VLGDRLFQRRIHFGGDLCIQLVEGRCIRALTLNEPVARARAGEGPSFLVCHTYRFHGHHVGDVDRSYYRAREEEERWREERDPLRLLADRLTASSPEDAAALERLDHEVAGEIAAALEHALAAPYPDPSEVSEDVYA
jgi:pyruvate dehydrogenase E1 component alpha subunit